MISHSLNCKHSTFYVYFTSGFQRPNLQQSAANWHPSAPPLSSVRWDCHTIGLLGLYFSSQFLAPCIRDAQSTTVADWEWTLAFWLAQVCWDHQLSRLFSYLFDNMGWNGHTVAVNKKFTFRFEKTIVLWCESFCSVTVFPSSEFMCN